jgi:putative colanic acid biosynthesis acetyltransferase WcaF
LELRNKVDLSSFNNDWYSPGKSALIRLVWYYVNTWFINSYSFPFSGIKIKVLRLFGAKIASGCVIKPAVNIKYPWKLTVGKNVWIGENVWIDNLDEVSIGDNVCLSQGAFLLCGNHNYKKTSFDLIVRPIQLKEGAWIGAKTTICPGTIVGSHAVVSVGAIASNVLEDYGIYKGNPAVKVGERKVDE